MKHPYSHRVECAVRAQRHANAACVRLGIYLIAQQRPDFKKQNHLFGEAALEFKKALKWARAGEKPPMHQ